MYKLINKIAFNTKIHNSFWFKIYNDQAFFIRQGNLFVCSNVSKVLKSYEETEINLITSIDSIIVGNDKIGYDIIQKDFLIEKDQKLKGFKIPFDSKSDKIYIFKRDKKLKIYQSGIYDLKYKRFSFILDSITNIKFVENEVYINADLIRFDNNGNELWNLNKIKDKMQEVTKFLGIFQNSLIVTFKNYTIYSIDLSTGEVIFILPLLKNLQKDVDYFRSIFYSDDFIFDENDKLIGVFSKYYIEINLITQDIEFFDLEDELNNNNLNSFRRMGENPFTKNYIFVTAHAELDERPNTDLDCVLALNRCTKKIDWVYVFKDTGLGTNVPQLTSTHLYQLDTNNTLHIFELAKG